MLDEGAAVGAPMPLTSTLARVLALAQAQGLADADNSAVIALLRDWPDSAEVVSPHKAQSPGRG
jgi:hypothetical protein